MNHEQNNLSPNNVNTQGNNGIPNNQPLNNQGMGFNQQPISHQSQLTPSFQQPIMHEPTSKPTNNTFESVNASNQNFNSKPAKKVNLGLIIGIVAAVVVVGVGIVFGSKLLSNGRSNNNSNNDANKNENLETTDKASKCVTRETINYGSEIIIGQYKYKYYTRNGAHFDASLVNKQSTEDITSKFCAYINDIPVTGLYNLFGGSKAKKIDLSTFKKLDENVEINGGFFKESMVEFIDFSLIDISNVSSLEAVFEGSNATKINMVGVDTSNIKVMTDMFRKSKVQELDLSSFNTSNVHTMSYMFAFSEVKKINLNSFDTSKVTDMSGMFYNFKGNELDLSSFDFSSLKTADKMFAGTTNGLVIYLKNEEQKNKLKSLDSEWQSYTNITIQYK